MHVSSIVPVVLFGVGRVVVVKDIATLIDYFGINEFLEEILQLVKLLALLIFLLDLYLASSRATSLIN